MSTSAGPNIVEDGLVFYVDFANSKSYSGSGPTVQNLIKNVSNGEFVDSPTYSSNNKGKLSFVTNDGIRFPEDNTLDIQNPVVSVWFRPNTADQNGFLFEKGTVNTQYSIFLNSSGNGRLYWRQRIAGTLTNLVIPDSSIYLSTTNFNNIIGTYQSGSRKIFINGIKVAEDSPTGVIDTTNGGMSIGVYGGYSGSRSYWYNGDIGAVSVYNKQFSDAEIKQNFNALRGRYGI